MYTTAQVRELLTESKWHMLWRHRDGVDWTYAAEHVPSYIQWFMVIAATIEKNGWEENSFVSFPFWVQNRVATSCMRKALDMELEAGRDSDDRLWEAVHAKERWMNGEIKRANLETYKTPATEAVTSTWAKGDTPTRSSVAGYAAGHAANCVFYGMDLNVPKALVMSLQALIQSCCYAAESDSIKDGRSSSRERTQARNNEWEVIYSWITMELADALMEFACDPKFMREDTDDIWDELFPFPLGDMLSVPEDRTEKYSPHDRLVRIHMTTFEPRCPWLD